MAGVRIRNEFYNGIEDVKYRVDIYDESFVGTTIETFENFGFSLNYQSESDSFLYPIKDSSCKYMLYDDGSSDFTSFKTDLSQAQENQFKLVIYRYNIVTPEIFWAGIIMTDLVSWDNDNSPRSFEIIAKDGLNRLENIEFDKVDASPYLIAGVSYPQTFLKVIFDCLSYTGTAQFWNGTPLPYIAVCTTWKDAAMNCDNSSEFKQQSRSLELVRIDRDFLFDHTGEDTGIKSKKVYLKSIDDKPIKTKIILKELLQLLGLRIMLSEGTWYITQVTRYTASSATFCYYDYSGAYDNTPISTTKTLRVAPTVLNGGKYLYAPSLRKVSATILPSDILNITDVANVTIDNTNLTNTRTIQLGTIYGGAGTGLKLRFDYNYIIPFWNVAAYGTQFNILVTIKFIATDSGAVVRRVKARAAGSYTSSNPEWTTVAADNIQYTVDPFYNMNTKSDRLQTISFTTPEIPFNIANSCTLEITTALTGGTPSGAASNAQCKVLPMNITLLDSTETIGQITEKVSINPFVNALSLNSYNLDLGNLRIHDTGIIGSKNTLETDEYVGAGRWGKSTVWSAGYGSSASLVETILKENISLQKKTIKKYQGAFRGQVYNAWNTLDYDSSYWVFMAGTFNSNTSEWDGTWFEIIRNTSSVTLDSDKKYNNVGDNGKVRPANPWDVKPRMVWHPPLGSNTIFPMEKGKISASYPTSGGAITTATIESADYAHLRAGDSVMIINPITREVLSNFVLSADVAQGATSISFASATPTYDIATNSEVCLDANQLIVSEKVRATVSTTVGGYDNYKETFILKGQTIGITPLELTTNGLTASGSSNRIQIHLDCSVLFKIFIIGQKDGEKETSTFEKRITVNNDGGSTTDRESTQTIGTDLTSDLGGSVSITSDNADDVLTVTVTGVALTVINWTAIVEGYFNK